MKDERETEVERHMRAMSEAVKTIAEAVVFMKKMLLWLLFNDIVFAVLIVIIFWKISA